jgi:opacity protein-like surface antigen
MQLRIIPSRICLFLVRWMLQRRTGVKDEPSRPREESEEDGDLPMNQLCASCSVNRALLLTALGALFSGPPAYARDDLRRAIPPPGKALVFVFRVDREPLAAQVPVIVNKELIGELANGTFVAATVSPGPTQLRIGQRLVSALSFVATADQSYFVRVEAIDVRTLVRTVAHPVSEPEGRRSLAQSRFVGVAPAVVIPPVVIPPVVAPPPVAAPPDVTPTVVAPAPPAEPPATQPTPAREVSAPAEPGRDWDFALIASAGTFKLADGNQVIAGLARTYDTTSKSVFGVEAEWRHKAGFALGAEVFSYKNDLVTTGALPGAQQKVLAIMVNGKYYFRAASWFYPFVGAGIGQANASYSGGLTGDASGLAYQGMAGMEFRFKPVGLHVQYKSLASKTGSSGREVKVDGSGIVAGVSITF